MKKFIVLALVALALFLPSYALAFTLETNDTEINVYAGESLAASFSLFTDTADRFSIHASGLYPWMTLEDVGRVGENSTETFNLYISPFHYVSTGTYQVIVEAQSENTGEKIQKSIFITVLKKVYTGIENVYISGNLEPMGYVDIKVGLKNTGLIPMQNVELYVRMDSPDGEMARFSETIRYVNPQETTYIEKRVAIDPLAKYGRYTVQARVFYNDELFSQKTQEFDVMPMSIINENQDENGGLVSKDVDIRVTNFGNDAANNILVNRTFSSFDLTFFKQISGPVPTFHENQVFWLIDSINPGETENIIYKIDYTPIYLIFILAAAAAYTLLFYIRVAVVRKDVIKKNDDEILVKIEVKNNTGHEIDSVILKDTVPLMFHVKSFVGLRPVKKRTEDGSEIVWRVRKLKPDEERVFSYTLNPVVGIIGAIKMPRAKIFYKKEKELRVSKSNIPILL